MEDFKEKAEKQVRRATILLWASLVCSGLGSFLMHLKGRESVEDLFIVSFILAIYVVLVMSLSGGMNWARWILLVLTLLSAPVSIPLIIQDYLVHPVIGVVTFLSVAISLLAMWLVFTSPGKFHFVRADHRE